MAVCQTKCEFLLEFDNNLPFLKKGVSFLNAIKPKGGFSSTSFEFQYRKGTRNDQDRWIGLLKMRQNESSTAISELSMTVPFQVKFYSEDDSIDEPESDQDINFYCWFNISLMHAIVKDATLNDKLVFIGFRSTETDRIKVVVAPHHNRSSASSVIRNEHTIKIHAEEAVPQIFFDDARMDQLMNSVIYSFGFKVSEFGESISQSSAIIKATMGNKDNNKDFDNQTVELKIHFVCPNFVWLSMKTGDENCFSEQKMKCLLPQPLPCSKKIPQECFDLPPSDRPHDPPQLNDFRMFELDPIFKAGYLHKRIFQMYTNFRGDNCEIQCNIAGNQAPISFVYYSEWTKEQVENNFLKFTVAPKM